MTKANKRTGAVVIVHKAAQPKKKTNIHRHVQYSVTSTQSNTPRISASASTVHTLLSPEARAAVDETIDMEVDNFRNDIPDDDPLDVPVDQAYLAFLALNPINSAEKMKRLRKPGDESLHHFIPQAGLFLEEMIGLEGRPPLTDGICRGCVATDNPTAAEYECLDCSCREMWCSMCIISMHSRLFLHRIQKWNGRFFEKTSLKELGLRIQLGHRPGDICLNPEAVRNDDFVVVDIDGVHNVSLDFCGCGNVAQHHITQLLRSRLFPATIINPKTAATFRCLKYLEVLSYESKVSTFEFFQALSRCTDNTDTLNTKDRYPELLRMIHEWRYLKLIKRAGRGHSILGIQGTQDGECAVLCPACPQLGKNMAKDWDLDESRRYLHTIFMAVDANFRLKRKHISNGVADPGLVRGAAYFVEEVKYKDHLNKFKDEKEPKSTCSRHDAVNLSEKSSAGHAATGIGACVCARHDMKRPSSVGDLQRGERYCNMDYLFYMTMQHAAMQPCVVSYDIACQWSINLEDRMMKIDPNFPMFGNGDSDIRYLVPKFHLPAHISKCREAYSFNYAKGTGRTDGEAPERGWVYINGLATSTREMGPGSRFDTLDCHMGDENWKKVSGMGASLLRKMKAAARDMAEQVISHWELTSTIPVKTVEQWTEEVELWEVDHSRPNPYEVTTTGPTQASVLREMAEDEARDIANSRDMSLDDKVTPSVLISLGLHLECEQRRLKVSASKVWEHALDRQRTKHQLQLNTLQRKIDAWITYHQLYIPGAQRLRQLADAKRTDSPVDIKAYEADLWLPSQIKGMLTVPIHLKRIEWKLRHSQAHEALDIIQTQLQIRAHLYKFKDRFVRGQGANTRARNTINGIDAKINTAAEEYRAAYDALCALSPSLFEVQWRNELLPLLPEDIRDMSEGRETRKGKESEGKRTLSWIWKKVPVENMEDNEYLTNRMRSEWCKSRARATRLQEEVSLLSEEMMRVRRFFDWKANDWLSRTSDKLWPANMPYMLQSEGRIAYAERQASMYRNLKSHCDALWKDLPAYVARMLAIIDNPSLAEHGEFDEPAHTQSKYNN